MLALISTLRGKRGEHQQPARKLVLDSDHQHLVSPESANGCPRFKKLLVARAMRWPGLGAQFVRRLATSRPWGQIMKTLTSAQLFAARERAAETAQYAAQPSRPMPPPTVLQRRRLVTLARCTGLRTLNRE